jgi:hypothetical protein
MKLSQIDGVLVEEAFELSSKESVGLLASVTGGGKTNFIQRLVESFNEGGENAHIPMNVLYVDSKGTEHCNIFGQRLVHTTDSIKEFGMRAEQLLKLADSEQLNIPMLFIVDELSKEQLTVSRTVADLTRIVNKCREHKGVHLLFTTQAQDPNLYSLFLRGLQTRPKWYTLTWQAGERVLNLCTEWAW